MTDFNPDDPSVRVDIDIDPDSIGAIAATIEETIRRAIQAAFAAMPQAGRSAQRQARTAAQAVTQALNAQGQAAIAARNSSTAYYNSLANIQPIIVSLVQALQQLQLGTTGVAAALADASNQRTRIRSNERQAAISEREVFSRDAQLRIQAIKNRGRIEYVESQRRLIQERDAGKQRILITQAVLQTIGRLEKGFGVALAATTRTAANAVKSTLSGLGSFLRRESSGFDKGLSSNLTIRERLFSRSFNKQEQILRDSATRQSQILNEINQRTSRGALGAITGKGVGGGLLPGLAAGGGLAALFTTGFQRFNELERINKQFVALTGNVDAANTLLEEVKQFAKETPFDLVGVADLAKGFLAIKTPLDQVLPRVRAISDAVALTGGGVEELNRIQRAIGQVVSAGRLQGDELNQLAENLPGLNIRQILADQLTGGNVQALIKMQEAGEVTADKFVNGLITGLQQDKRLVGASAALAETVGGRLANLKESFSDVGAALFQQITTPMKILIGTLNDVFASLAQFVRGEDLGPVLTVLREGLKGAAVALGAVFGARAGVETLRLLSIALSGLLSPMGLFLTAVGSIGAAFAIVFNKSAEFREAVKQVWDVVSVVWSDIKDAITGAIRAITDAFGVTKNAAARTFEPISEVFVGFAERVGNGIRVFGEVMTETVIPAVTRFIIFFGNEVVPVIKNIAVGAFNVLADVAERVGRVLSSVFSVIRPLLQPAIDGFTALAGAIQAALTGDFSALGGGAKAALSGIASTIGNLVGALVDALKPVGAAIGNFFADLFTEDNFESVTDAVLGFVYQVGRFVGSLVSDPTFLKIVAGVATAIAVVAFNLLKGVLDGVLSNLDDLLSEVIGAGLAAGLKFIFDNILKAIGIGVLLYALLPKLRQAFGMAGKESAKALGDGFTQGAAAQQGRIASTMGFLRGAFGGTESVLSAASGRTFAAETARVAQLQEELRLLGSATQIDMTSELSISSAVEELEQLRESMTDAERAGLRFGDTVRRTFAGMRNIVAGVARTIGLSFKSVFVAVGAGFQNLIRLMQTSNATQFGPGSGLFAGLSASFSAAAAQVRLGFTQLMAVLRSQAAAQGISVGRLIGRSLSAGIQTVGQVGLSAILGGYAAGQSGGSTLVAGLTAGLTGLAIGGPVVGLAAAGVSLIAAKFGEAKKNAQEFDASVAEAASTIKTDLVKAIEGGTLLIGDFKDGLDFGDIGGFASIAETFRTELDDSTKELFASVGITIEGIQRVLTTAENPLKGLQNFILDGFEASTLATYDGSRELNNAFAVVFDGIRKRIAEGGEFDPEDSLSYNVSEDAIDAVTRLYDLADVAGITADEIDESFAQLFSSFNDVNEVVAITTEALGDLDLDIKVFGAGGDVPLMSDLLKVDEIIGDINGRTTILNDSIDRLFRPRTGTDFEAVFDTSLIEARALGEQAQRAAEEYGIDSPEFRQVQRQIANAFSTTITEGVNSGLIVDEESAANYAGQIQDVLIDGVTDPSVVAALNETYTTAFAGVTLENVVTQLLTAQQAQELVNQATTAIDEAFAANPEFTQAIIDAFGSTTSPAATNFVQLIAGALATNPDAMESADTFIRSVIGELGKPENVDGFKDIGTNAGAAILDGLIDKLFGDEGIVSVGIKVGDKFRRALNDELLIDSPSKVMMQTGGYIIDGLRAGVERRLGDVEAAAVDIGRVFANATITAPVGVPDFARASSTGMQSADSIDRLARRMATASPSNVTINQTFNEKADSRAIATDIAWRLS